MSVQLGMSFSAYPSSDIQLPRYLNWLSRSIVAVVHHTINLIY